MFVTLTNRIDKKQTTLAEQEHHQSNFNRLTV